MMNALYTEILMRLGSRGRLSYMNIHIRFNGEKTWQEFTSYKAVLENANISSEGLDSSTSIIIIFIMCIWIYIIGLPCIIVN